MHGAIHSEYHLYDHFLLLVISGSFSSMESAVARFSLGALRGVKFFLFLRTVRSGVDVGVPQSCSAPLHKTPSVDCSTSVSTAVVPRGLLGGPWRFFFWVHLPRFGKSFQTVPFVDSDVSLVHFDF